MVGGIRDGLNLLRKSSPTRVWNAIRVFSSFQSSRLTGKATISGMPVSLSFEPTTSCNLRCPECPSGLRAFTRPTGMLDERLFQDVIAQVSPALQYLTFYFQGEPYLHPNFLKMVSYARRRGIYTATSTNGHFLGQEMAAQTVRSGLDRLIVSIDGTTQETYSAYRIGGTLEKVIQGTKHIISAKRRLRSRLPHVVFQFLVVRPNEHQIEDVYRLAKQLGVDQVVLKTAQINDFAHGSPLMPEQDKYSRYVQHSDGTFAIRNALDDHCWKMWHSCVVTWDGKVVPCCFDKDAHYVMGDLRTQTFRDIWYGPRYREFRQTLLRSRKEIEMCRNCTEGTKVWA